MLVNVATYESPFARFNLRRNPFGELTRQERAELAVVDMEPWRQAISSSNTALQFIGPKGHGKSTHLLAIASVLGDAPLVYLPEDGPLPSIPTTRPLLIDEAQRLDRRQRRDVFKLGGPLVLGTHEDLSSELRQNGFHVITQQVDVNGSPERLMTILNKRIDACRISDAPVPRIDRQQAVTLLRECGSNIRRMEEILYDQIQTAVQKGLPWPTVN